MDYKQELFMNAFGVEGIWDGDLADLAGAGMALEVMLYSRKTMGKPKKNHRKMEVYSTRVG